jgi:tRNA(Ile)-lysidine synthase
LRYAFFEEIMAKENYDFCALAHHADDQAETLFMSLLKGNSPQIWKAMPIKRGKYVRPLLHIRKAEILEMAAQINLPFCTDSSNLKNDYSRNFTRNVVFPALSQLNVAFVNHLLAKNDLYTQQIDFIHLLLQKYISTENELHFAPFVQDFSEDFLPLLIRFFCQKKDISGYLIQEICDLQGSISGKYVNISGGKILRTRTGLAFISAEKEPLSPQSYELKQEKISIFFGENELIFTFPLDEKVDFSATKNGKVFYIDTKKTLFPLQIRSYHSGDKMMPLGMHNYKKISDIMIDKKYSFQQKQVAFVITDAAGEIIALSGFRVSEKVKMQENSQAILKLLVVEPVETPIT